jgi:hypothetical protein
MSAPVPFPVSLVPVSRVRSLLRARGVSVRVCLPAPASGAFGGPGFRVSRAAALRGLRGVRGPVLASFSGGAFPAVLLG